MTTLSVILSNPASSGLDLLFIEQEEYAETDGYLSRAALYHGLSKLLAGEQITEPVCKDDCSTTMHVYRRDLGLDYRLAVSHGALGECQRNEGVYTENLDFTFEDSANFSYPCFGMVESHWLGGVVYDQDGATTDPPGLTVDIDGLTLSSKVYGTLAVTYRINRDSYSLNLPGREGSIENRYSSVAYALYSGGIVWLPVDPPPGAEESGQQCTGGYGGSGFMLDPEDDPPTHCANADAEVVTDYCSQVIIRDTSK